VRLSVEDQGIGIAADDLSHVFERFHGGGNVDAVAGSGIGLTSVVQIVQQHGGVLDIASDVGCGARVSVWLPLYQSLGDIPRSDAVVVSQRAPICHNAWALARSSQPVPLIATEPSFHDRLASGDPFT